MDGSNSGVVVEQLMLTQDSFILGPITVRFSPGKIHCLLGPNGAGKTTLIRAIMGIQKRQTGSVTVEGFSGKQRSPEVLQRIGLVPDDAKQLIEELTAPEFWSLTARMYAQDGATPQQGVDRAMELAQVLEFSVPPRKTISAFSLGMRKKTQIIAALLHNPAVLILDEPRNGLDPIGIHRMEKLVQQVAERGATVIAASHDLDWAQRFADEIHILNKGILEASGTVEELSLETETTLLETFLRIVGEAHV